MQEVSDISIRQKNGSYSSLSRDKVQDMMSERVEFRPKVWAPTFRMCEAFMDFLNSFQKPLGYEELRVFILALRGISIERIATVTGKSHHTVADQLKSISIKFGNGNRVFQLVRLVCHLTTHLASLEKENQRLKAEIDSLRNP